MSCNARLIGVVSYLEALYDVVLLWNNSPVLELPQNEAEFEQMEVDLFAAATTPVAQRTTVTRSTTRTMPNYKSFSVSVQWNIQEIKRTTPE